MRGQYELLRKFALRFVMVPSSVGAPAALFTNCDRPNPATFLYSLQSGELRWRIVRWMR